MPSTSKAMFDRLLRGNKKSKAMIAQVKKKINEVYDLLPDDNSKDFVRKLIEGYMKNNKLTKLNNQEKNLAKFFVSKKEKKTDGKELYKMVLDHALAYQAKGVNGDTQWGFLKKKEYAKEEDVAEDLKLILENLHKKIVDYKKVQESDEKIVKATKVKWKEVYSLVQNNDNGNLPKLFGDNAEERALIDYIKENSEKDAEKSYQEMQEYAINQNMTDNQLDFLDENTQYTEKTIAESLQNLLKSLHTKIQEHQQNRISLQEWINKSLDSNDTIFDIPIFVPENSDHIFKPESPIQIDPYDPIKEDGSANLIRVSSSAPIYEDSDVEEEEQRKKFILSSVAMFMSEYTDNEPAKTLDYGGIRAFSIAVLGFLLLLVAIDYFFAKEEPILYDEDE
ncbi:MAG: hypothetical protein AAF335_04155 [Bacteroidota bacterium]